MVEQYVTYPVNAKVQDRFAESLLLNLIEDGPKALANTDDYEVRANLMWTATMALNGLIGVGVPTDWATHMIGQEITGLYGLDHGQTLAIVQPAVWIFKKNEKHAKLVQYAERVWGLVDGDDETKINNAIERTRQFFETMGVKTRLSDYGLDRSVIPTVVEKLKQHGHVRLGELADITPTEVEAILELAM